MCDAVYLMSTTKDGFVFLFFLLAVVFFFSSELSCLMTYSSSKKPLEKH